MTYNKRKIIRINTMNAETYLNILDSEHKILDELKEAGVKYLQQDSLSSHKAVQTLVDNKGLLLLEWPVYSADLSPIERIWGELKTRVTRKMLSKQVKVNNEEDLWNLIQQIFYNEMEVSFSENLIESMPSKLCKVVGSLGGLV